MMIVAHRPLIMGAIVTASWVGQHMLALLPTSSGRRHTVSHGGWPTLRGMMFLGLGTGLGSAMVVEGVVIPMELGHLSYRKGTYEDYVGLRGLEKRGKKKWRKHVAEVVERVIDVLHPDDVVLGGGNAKLLMELPPGCRLGDNANAFLGGFRLWEKAGEGQPSPRTEARSSSPQGN